MTPGADVSRVVIDAIERSQPGAVYLEHDEEGRARAVRLELAPRDEDIEEALAAIASEPADRTESVERCLGIMREVANTHARVEVEIAKLRSCATLLGPKAANDLLKAARKRQDEAWSRARRALEQLVDEAPL